MANYPVDEVPDSEDELEIPSIKPPQNLSSTIGMYAGHVISVLANRLLRTSSIWPQALSLHHLSQVRMAHLWG